MCQAIKQEEEEGGPLIPQVLLCFLLKQQKPEATWSLGFFLVAFLLRVTLFMLQQVGFSVFPVAVCQPFQQDKGFLNSLHLS